MFSRLDTSQRSALAVCLLALVGLIGAAAVVPDRQRLEPWAEPEATAVAAPIQPTPTPTAEPQPTEAPPSDPPATGQPEGPSQVPAGLPHGATSIFGDDTFLVAYYGTADTGALGVLGEQSPEKIMKRLDAAAAPFARKGSPTQEVFELIVTVADGYPGDDGDYAHDISKEQVQRYIDAAHEHDVLLLLDIQPGRTSFAQAARRWGWALKDPYVGLALDPEWRMGKHQVPAHVVGSVGAREINETSAWLRDLVRRNNLPQKLFVLHQFRTDMIRDIEKIKPRTGLAMVQHVDGFGTPGQKLDTFHAVARPKQFRMGFKLFYDEDVHRMSAADVRRIRPKVRFVSFQ
jgi:hypothetical protein